MSSFLKDLLNETRKINEEDLFSDGEASPEATAEIPAATEEVPAEEPAAEGLQITDELIAELTAANPGIAEVDPAEFKSGLECEIGCLEAVGGDVNLVASIVLCKLSKFPGKDYYGAVKTMEASLVEPEVPAEGGEVPVTEPAFAEEEVVEEGKGKEALAQKTQTDGKAMSQVKNESAVATDTKMPTPGAQATPEEKKDETDAAKDAAHTSGQAKAHKAVDQLDMNKVPTNPKPTSTSNETVATPGKETTAEEKKDEKEAAADEKHTKEQAAKHKAEDKKDMDKKDVNPKQK